MYVCMYLNFVGRDDGTECPVVRAFQHSERDSHRHRKALKLEGSLSNNCG